MRPEIQVKKKRSKNKDNQSKIQIVGIGASAGGLESIEAFFENFPADSNLSFIIIQHLSPNFKSFMPDILSRKTNMKVKLAEDNEKVKKNVVYLLPPRKNLSLEKETIILSDIDLEQLPNKPIDIFFKSLASNYKENSIGIILSGTGTDGTKGIRAINEMGGKVFVETPKSAKFDGMPNSALSTKKIDYVGTGLELCKQVASLVGKHVDLPVKNLLDKKPEKLASKDKILAAVHERFGIDFSLYKNNTVDRRLKKQLKTHNLKNLDSYASYVENSSEEASNLFYEMLVGVTEFFRDKEAFKYLAKKVIKPIISQKKFDEEIRVWIPGCSNGMEVYSIAILFNDHFRENDKRLPLKIFATDINDVSLEKASQGVYLKTELSKLSEQQIANYFNNYDDDNYKVKPELRKAIVFTRHNFLADPPFMNVDLISCRNALIYLDQEPQRNTITSMYYALNNEGFLFLGPSESIGDLNLGYKTINSKWKIFQKNKKNYDFEKMYKAPKKSVSTSTWLNIQSKKHYTEILHTKETEVKKAYESLLQEYVPASLLINSQLEIIHIFGDAGKFLRQKQGPVSQNIKDLLQENIALMISIAIQRASNEAKNIVYEGLIESDNVNEAKNIQVRVRPIFEKSNSEIFKNFLVSIVSQKKSKSKNDSIDTTEVMTFEKDSLKQVSLLESELQKTKKNLYETNDALLTSNEELQSANEELVASNEELQSTNEELHSVNEELYTVNSEYQKKIEELIVLTKDEKSFLKSTGVGSVFLDSEMKVRKYTPLISEEFYLLPQDIGRPFKHISHNLKIDDLEKKLDDVLRTKKVKDLEIVSHTGKEYLLRILPYLNEIGVNDGAVLTFIDITVLNRTAKELNLKIIESQKQKNIAEQLAKKYLREKQRSEVAEKKLNLFNQKLDDQVKERTEKLNQLTQKYQDLYDYSPDMQVSVSAEDSVVYECNLSLVKKLGYTSKDEVIGKKVFDLYHPSSLQQAKKAFEKFQLQGFLKNFELHLQRRDGSAMDVLLNATSIKDEKGTVVLSRSSWTDISEVKKFQSLLSEKESMFDVMSELNTDGWWDWDLTNPKEEYLSPGLKKVFGYEDHEVPNKSSWWQENIFPEDKEKALKAFDEHVNEGKSYNLTVRYRHKNGSTVWVICRGFVIKNENGKPVRMLGTHTDVTALKESQRELRKTNEELEQFAYLASHDLQAPLRHIVSYIELIREKINPELNQELEKWFGYVTSGAYRMTEIIEHLLQFSRIGKQGVKFRETNLNYICKQVISMLENQIKNSGSKVTIKNRLPKVYGDETLMYQVFQNIIENALKFKKEKTTHSIKIDYEENDTTYIISIKDNGIGIDQKQHEKVFQIFQKLDVSDSGKKGVGIGLAICKKIIHLHQGEIWLVSSPNKGCTFYISLPKSNLIKSNKIK